MRDTNIVVMVGRLTKDPDISQTANGFKSVRFSIANSDDFRRKDGEEVKRTNFVNCEAYGGTAEVIEKYTEKGKQVLVTGKMYVREAEKDGKRTWFSGITVETIQLLGSKNGHGTAENPSQKKDGSGNAQNDIPDYGTDESFDFPEDMMGDLGNDAHIPF